MNAKLKGFKRLLSQWVLIISGNKRRA
ncbi:hypothetical protein EBL_c04710 [Shimwellia blattae DSM 4481 = NBRC 105725]|uniref:Uncharacterized protein n=1 Tax=Shimwellia blattae (strain ATCC 29907 / DSM 4481 / JCM 1650 / NBRC 105725 / CDC 9005-74) TaxID=630626 RepID=I2B4Z3_SHIBC|nr:hypothetical protein EBL_c04710 [Shimwellia blattae DSM 4481 = NBRC 105725]